MKLHVAPRTALTGVAHDASAADAPALAIGDAKSPAWNHEPNV
jgi:hypothetical protein